MDAKAEVTGDQIALSYEKANKTPSKAYLRVLLRKFLHQSELKEWFRVISGAEKTLVIKAKK